MSPGAITFVSFTLTVEAVEHAEHPWLVAVQWHPELTAARDACQQSFFDELVRRSAR